MNITASICTDIYAIFLLMTIIWLANMNPIGDKYINKIYISVSKLTIILLVLEIFTVLIGHSNNSKLVIPHRIANVMGFSFSPVVPYLLSNFLNGKKKGIKDILFSILLYFNIIMCIISYSTGWIFFVDDHNQYYRGKLFLIPMIISVFFYVRLLMKVKKIINDNKNEVNKFIVLIIFLPMLGAILQILFKDILLIWGNMAVSLVLYYILMRELQFRYDSQTGIKNRLAFEKAMKKYIEADKNAAIVVLDINFLKRINDKYGHKVGDDVIINAARIIQNSFTNIGEAFRIGGDEFCVICEEITQEKLDVALTKLDELINRANKDRIVKIEMAYGYDFYDKNENENIYSIFSKADHAMYEHKSILKGLYGRRSTDN